MLILRLQIIGCTCYVRDIRPHITKLYSKSLRCIFLGYSRTHKGYQCYSSELGRFLMSADVVFYESILFSSFSFYADSPRSFSLDDLLIYDSATISSTQSGPLVHCPL
ncbi:hypothetical protein U1Q18_052393 [Sarracenia purpurea var. burkii]